MTFQSEIKLLESEWAIEDGFFWQIREGAFAHAAFERALKKVSAISVPEDADMPKRLVSLLWYIPLFMHWQVARIQENGGDVAAYGNALQVMTNEIERLLGVP